MKQRSTKERREGVLSHLASEYRDALQYTTELRRAIDSFSGEIPPNSPLRYLRLSVGESIVDYVTRAGKPQKIAALVKELHAGNCPFGAVKSPEEIVRKAVNAFAKSRRLQWMDDAETLVGLGGWSKNSS